MKHGAQMVLSGRRYAILAAVMACACDVPTVSSPNECHDTILNLGREDSAICPHSLHRMTVGEFKSEPSGWVPTARRDVVCRCPREAPDASTVAPEIGDRK